MKPPREMGVLSSPGISESIPPEPIGIVFVVFGGLGSGCAASELSMTGSATPTQSASRLQEVSSIASWLTWRDVIPRSARFVAEAS